MSESKTIIDPKHSILLVMDYQPGILSRLPNSGELVSNMAGIIKTARAKNIPIGYVRVAFVDSDYSAIPKNNLRFKEMADKKMMHADSLETAIHDDLAPQKGDIIVRKTRVGAFSTTDLGKQLKDRQIDTIILAGISTSGVVLSTVRDASDHDYRIFVLEDGVADTDVDVHKILLDKVLPRQATIISSSELFSQL
jgi:nicotinamidase-related amidase